MSEQNQFNIVLSLEDHLNFQLYTASKSKNIKNKRIFSWILSVIVFLVLGFLFYQNENQELLYYFVAAAVISSLFFPFYSRWRYRLYYKRHILQHLKNRLGKPSILALESEEIVINDGEKESKILWSNLEQITEIKEQLFIRLKSGVSLIIPRRTERFQQLKGILKNNTKNNSVQWVEAVDWKWR